MGTSIRINQEIKSNQLRVIGSNGEQLGIMSLSDALNAAQKAGVDLIEISPKADPPVAKILDWGKFQYQKMKEQQKNRKHAKSAELKQIRIGLKIGSNDLDIKLRKVRDFLKDGHKVKIFIFYRGREMAHQEQGYEMMKRIISSLEDVAIIEQQPQMNGRNLGIVIRRK